jgi:hypothetical protein
MSVTSKKKYSQQWNIPMPNARNACGKWTLRVMFPPGYRVSNCEGYKQGSTWLRMKND